MPGASWRQSPAATDEFVKFFSPVEHLVARHGATGSSPVIVSLRTRDSEHAR